MGSKKAAPTVPPYAQRNTVQIRDATLPGEDLDPGLGKDGTSRRPGPHLEQNVLGPLRCGSPGLDRGLLGCLFSRRPHGPVSAYSLIWRKLGTRKSRLETSTQNEALSALLARLW